MHCHLIVSRKDQANKKKLSPLTNHKKTKKGIVIGGFDRKYIFQQAEQIFDNLFDYKRELIDSFGYYSTMKNGSISEQLNMQEQQLSDEKRKTNTGIQTNMYIDKLEELTKNKQNNSISNMQLVNQKNKKEDKQYLDLPNSSLFSALGLPTLDVGNSKEGQNQMKRKKKKFKLGFRQ